MCPCTRASISELARLVPRLRRGVSAWVVVVRPADAPAGWDDSGLWERASAIPGVSVIRDDGAVEAMRFRAATSGLTLLYDSEGRLRFTGGITALRGHEGDSLGQRRILSLVATGASDRADGPVFGCALMNVSLPLERTNHETRQ